MNWQKNRVAERDLEDKFTNLELSKVLERVSGRVASECQYVEKMMIDDVRQAPLFLVEKTASMCGRALVG